MRTVHNINEDYDHYIRRKRPGKIIFIVLFVALIIFLGYSILDFGDTISDQKEFQDNAQAKSDLYCGMTLRELEYFLGNITREDKQQSNVYTVYWEYEDTQQQLRAEIEAYTGTLVVIDMEISPLNNPSWSNVMECSRMGGELKTMAIDTTKIKYA